MRTNSNLRFFALFIAVCIFTTGFAKNQSNWSLNSPDKKITCQLLIENSKLIYQVNRIQNGKIISVIEKSPLGLIREDQQFAENLILVSQSKISRIDENYEMKIGRQLKIHNLANEKIFTFKNEKGSFIQLVFRAYNDGVAFKYVFPEKSDKSYTVTQELSGFKVPVNGKCWIQPYDKPSKWTPGYELYYESEIPIGSVSPSEFGWAFPALFNSNGNWVLISEANLKSNYCGIRMEQNAEKGLYKVRFPDPQDGEGTGAVNPSSTLPWEMPWRTIAIGNSISTIFESNLVSNVSDKQVDGDFSWVKPGRSSWSWISNPPSSHQYAPLKDFVDLAAEMKWEYSLVDANWERMEGGNIEQLVKYANEKGVGILLWYNSGGLNNKVTEGPRDLMTDSKIRRAEFKKIQGWGVKGVKIDFWQSDKQNIIQQYIDVLRDAAEFHILVNFHGCTLPRGWSRTYPNLVSSEAVKGEECYRFTKSFSENAPIQSTILSFTRNVIGPMDYTPFGITNLNIPHLSSSAHELALVLLFQTGIVHFAESAVGTRALPQFVKDFLYTVPVTFDESHLISGYPGKDVVIAARKGNDWYVSGINSEKNAKDLELKLPYLKGKYDLNLINDGTDNKSFVNSKKDYNSGDKLSVKVNSYGGFVIVLTKK